MKSRMLLLCVAMVQLGAASEEKVPAPRNDYLVGIYCFAGGWQKSPNKWETGATDWRSSVRPLGRPGIQLHRERTFPGRARLLLVDV